MRGKRSSDAFFSVACFRIRAACWLNEAELGAHNDGAPQARRLSKELCAPNSPKPKLTKKSTGNRLLIVWGKFGVYRIICLKVKENRTVYSKICPISGAGSGNRTRNHSLGSCCFATKLYLLINSLYLKFNQLATVFRKFHRLTGQTNTHLPIGVSAPYLAAAESMAFSVKRAVSVPFESTATNV